MRSTNCQTEKYPYGLERAEDLAGIGIAVVIWASAVFAGFESIRSSSTTGTPPTSR
jgi:divalent metal cation (Fe/Co/Zn/Cd) transporter